MIATIAWASPLAAAVALAFSSGGYFATSWGAAGIALLGLAAAAALVLRGSLGGRAGVAAAAGWGGLAAWQGISSAWADEPAAAIVAMNLTLLYAAALVLVLLGVRRARDLATVTWAALAAVAVVAAGALGARLLPALVSGDVEARLSHPITYWNGLGAVASLGALLAVATAAHPGRRRALAAVAGALVPMFLLVLLLTYSRGALLALLVGLALLLALAPGRIETVAAVVATVAASAPLLVIANASDELSAISGELPPHDDAGRRLLVVLLASMAASAAVAAAASWAVARLPEARRRPAGLAVAAAAVAVALALVAARPPDGGPVAWGDRQLDSFRSFDPGAREGESIADRLAVAAGSGRWQNWGVAVDQFRESPAVGTGAGDYRFRWTAERDIDLFVVNAHSVYLEVLGESGLVGLVLLLTAPAAVAIAVGLALRRRPGATVARDLATALAAAAVVMLHAGGDWDWQLPAVVLPAVALGAAALKAAALTTGPERAMPAPARWSLAVAAILAVAVAAGPTAAAARLTEARDTATAGDPAGALALAREARGLSPADPQPWLLEANLLTDLGRPAEADRAFAAAMARSPSDWTIPADWASALLRRGDAEAARVAALRAARLNPLEPRTRYLVETTE